MTETANHEFGKMLAVEQVRHYQHLKQAAAGCGDKTEYRRCVDQIDILLTQYGLKLNRDGEYEE